MRKKVFGKTNLMVTPVAMGGIPIMRLSNKEAVDVVRKVLAMGVNFIDTEPEKEIIPLARKMNLGFIAMKPLGGGLLEDAALAFRYLAQFSGIVADPGIEKAEEMEETLRAYL